MKKILTITLLLLVLGMSVDNNKAFATENQLPKVFKMYTVTVDQQK